MIWGVQSFVCDLHPQCSLLKAGVTLKTKNVAVLEMIVYMTCQ